MELNCQESQLCKFEEIPQPFVFFIYVLSESTDPLSDASVSRELYGEQFGFTRSGAGCIRVPIRF
jgi:hypothetical protein